MSHFRFDLHVNLVDLVEIFNASGHQLMNAIAGTQNKVPG
jgi:hypothetical protein